jgi:hypothetical protein
MALHPHCAECDRLRLMHEQTITEYEGFIVRYQLAKMLGDCTAIASIEPMVYIASEDRNRVRRAILRHEGAKDGHEPAAKREERWWHGGKQKPS